MIIKTKILKNKGHLRVHMVLILLMFNISGVFTQNNLSPQWLTSSVGEQWDLISHMTSGTSGDIFVAGNFSGTTTAESGGRNLTGKRDIFIARYTNKGENTWLHNLSSTGYCYVSSIQICDDDELLVCGYFRGDFDLDGNNLKSTNGSSLFIAKINESGEINWLTNLNGRFNGSKAFLVTGTNNDFYLCVLSSKRLEFDESKFGSDKNTNIMIGKFNQYDGQLIGNTLFTSSGSCVINDLLYSNESLYVAGSFKKELEIHNNIYLSKGLSDAFLIKLDNDLNPLFTKTFGGLYSDFGAAIESDSCGDLIYSGAFNGKMSLNDSVSFISNGDYDVFICKYNSSGETLWADSFGGTAGDIVSDININSYNDIYLTGTYRGEIEKGICKIISQKFSHDVFIAKYKSNGTFRYLESIGDTNTDMVNGLLIDNNNNILVSGNFISSFNLMDLEPDTAMNSEYYLAKLYDCDFSQHVKLPSDTGLCAEQFTVLADTGFKEYLWNGVPGGNQFIVDTTGIYILETTDEYNCVTVDTIIVKINQLPVVDLGEDIVTSKGEIITLYAGDGFVGYEWNTDCNYSYLDINTNNVVPGIHNYFVKVLDSNACVNHDSVEVEILDPSEKSLFVLAYPNPVTKFLSLEIHNVEPLSNVRVSIISDNGSIVLRNEIPVLSNSIKQRFNLHNLNTGIYNLRVEYNEVSKLVRFVKL